MGCLDCKEEEATSIKVVLKCATATSGEQSAMISGATMMLWLSADNWATILLVSDLQTRY